jgi:hypothetical protein
MATGDVKWFASALAQMANKEHDLDSDDIRLGIVTTANVPTVNEALPHWGGTGTTNFATNQVGTGGTSYTGPIALTGETLTADATGVDFSAGIVTLAQDASGFTNGAYGIFYNNTHASKAALGYVELSSAGTASLVSGQVVIDWAGAANEILSLAQS